MIRTCRILGRKDFSVVRLPQYSGLRYFFSKGSTTSSKSRNQANIQPSATSPELSSNFEDPTAPINDAFPHDPIAGSVSTDSRMTRRSQTADKNHPYNDTNSLKEARDLIISRKIRRRSVSFNLDVAGVEQKSVLPDGIDNTEKPPQLKGGLNRVLYQPGIFHQLRDPRSGVYLFDPELEGITPEFLRRESHVDDELERGDSVTPHKGPPLFITPHMDKSLLKLARKIGKQYISSTSSMTSVLSHLHYLLSNFRQLNITESSISKNFPQKHCGFTKSAKFPATIIMRKKGSRIRSLDADRSLDREIILSILGHSLERFLTQPKLAPNKEHYHYLDIDNFLVRSQLDAFDPKLPGSGVFDLKTRAVAAIRHDLPYVEQNRNFTGYQIDKLFGEFESFEREYLELISSTLLKYALQAKLGRMDGIFVAYHNISKMFGFQYLPLDELEFIIHSSYDKKFERLLRERNSNLTKIYGTTDFIINHLRSEREIARRVADREFKLSIRLLRLILQHIEEEIDKKLGTVTWEKCKLLMKTGSHRVTLGSGEQVSYPVLNIVAYPLPPDYVDKSILQPGLTDVEIHKKIQDHKLAIKAKTENPKFMNHVVGLEVRVLHHQASNPNSTVIPNFLDPKAPILPKSDSEYVTRILRKSWYSNIPSYQTPNFVHPDDVARWTIDVSFTPISNINGLKGLLLEFYGSKLSALENQSTNIDIDLINESPEEIRSRIRNFITQKNSHRGNSPDRKGKLSDFQETLRAYALRGIRKEELRKAAERNHVKVTWNV